VYLNFTAKINSPNRKKIYNIDAKSGEYRLGLDLSKNTFSVGNTCNCNNDNFEEMTERR
jgi:hypothetical protein